MNHLHPDELAAMAMDPDAGDVEERAHLDDCARCARELAVLRDVSSRARQARPDETPPAPPEAIWDRVVHELTEAGDLPVEPVDQVEPPRPAWQQPWAAAAALIGVVVLAAAVLLSFPGDDGAVVAEATLEPLADVQAATAVLTADGEQRELAVDTPVLPDIDGYYELWLLTPDGSGLVSLGPVTGTGRHEIPAAVDTDQYSVVDISREPSDGDPTHSTDSVLRGPLQPTT
ncbi:MAG TPA: anti-sigma factor [Euzebyales bacterium]|nr:anti-sigma factor [Euzebyales bacterium]